MVNPARHLRWHDMLPQLGIRPPRHPGSSTGPMGDGKARARES